MEELTTAKLLEIISNPEDASWSIALKELNARIIKEGDPDDSTQHRGGTRPTHQPLNP
jgi:hypothetical protein